jgi:5-methylcytosine-specific restriction endonuclease McrA
MDGTLPQPNAPTLEHVIPRSKRGSNFLANLVVACWHCNSDRGDRETP